MPDPKAIFLLFIFLLCYYHRHKRQLFLDIAEKKKNKNPI